MHINSYLESNMIDLPQYSIGKVIEVCAAQKNISNHLIILLYIFRSPSGNFGEFAIQLDLILKHLYKPKLEFIICGDFNVNLLIESSAARQLTLLLQSYNLFHVTDFATGTAKVSCSTIDNIFINYSRIN